MKFFPILCFLLITLPSYGETVFPHPFIAHKLKKDNISHLTCSIGNKCSITCAGIENGNSLLEIHNVNSVIYAINNSRHFYYMLQKENNKPLKSFTHFPLNSVSCLLVGLVNK